MYARRWMKAKGELYILNLASLHANSIHLQTKRMDESKKGSKCFYKEADRTILHRLLKVM